MTIPLIIDTDPGVDDALAIALAARSPEVDLIGVTTVFGNVSLEQTTRNALQLRALLGRPDVPIAAGADQPLVHPDARHVARVHGDDGLSGQAHTLPEPGELDPRNALTMFADLLSQAETPVTIAAIGPLTNIALLLAVRPDLKPRIGRLVIMGGGIGNGNVTAAAEFNIWSDPEAARRVLTVEDVPVTLVPVDLTWRCAVDAAWLDALKSSGPLGKTLESLTAEYRRHYRLELGFDGIAVHDAVAVAEAIRPGILTTSRHPVEVECSFGPSRGAVVADRRLDTVAERGIDLAVDTDLDGLRGFIGERLSG